MEISSQHKNIISLMSSRTGMDKQKVSELIMGLGISTLLMRNAVKPMSSGMGYKA